MPTFPATQQLAEAAAALMRAARLADGTPAYANVIIGGLKDYTDQMPVGVIFAASGSSERYTLGRSAKIHDKPRFNVASAVPYQDARLAEKQINAIRDAVTFQFQQSATLATPGVIVVKIVPESEQWSFTTINGSPARIHEFIIEVTYEYTLPQGPQP